MFIFVCTTPPNSLRSKKAFTHRRDISPMSMNCQYIYILLPNPLRPSALCRQAHFVVLAALLSAVDPRRCPICC